jgi:hypothetical protein
MRVDQMIERLKQLEEKYGSDTEVTITDGFQANCYAGDFLIIPFLEADDKPYTIDIGIGGCEIYR